LLTINPTHAEGLNNLGSTLLALGQLDDAMQAFDKAIELAPKKIAPYLNLAYSKAVADPSDPHFTAMQDLANDSRSLPEDDQIKLHFALGKAYADLRDYERSFDHLELGNSLQRQKLDYDESRTLSQFERIADVFRSELLRGKSGSGDPSFAPIFIVGLPRSGTTLVEQILASHPKLFGAGEIAALANIANSAAGPADTEFPESIATIPDTRWSELGAQYVRTIRKLAPNAERVTDKTPDNFLLLGLISIILPNARIIHVRRNALDTAVSCYSILFARGNEYSYDLAELGRYIFAYQKLMEHWRKVLPGGAMIEVQYEDLVRDLEPDARRIISHCGVDWDDACLAFHKTRRPVQSASAVQVRQPLYGRLAPLFHALEQGYNKDRPS
jgi:tetratricopeptide (TPR) repeat protein